MHRTRERQLGFTLIEILIALVIAAILVAIAIPVYASQRDKAKGASLEQSRHVAQVDVMTCLTNASLSTTYRASRGAPTSAAYKTAAGQYLSCAIESLLENGVESSNGDGIVNPCSNKKTVVNTASASLSSANANPAVFITSASGCRYAGFQQQSATIRSNLRGSVIVCWNTLASVNAIQLYYVGTNGIKSPTVAQVSLAP